MKRALQSPPAPTQQSQGRADISTRPLKGWRTTKELAEELRFPNAKACREWLRREHIVGVRRGRVILVDGLDVQKALRKVAVVLALLCEGYSVLGR
jgi:hypothetical protein